MVSSIDWTLFAMLGQYLTLLVAGLPWQASWPWFCWNASWKHPSRLLNLLRFGSNKYNRQHLIKSVCSKNVFCKTVMDKEAIKTDLKTRRYYVSKACWILYLDIFLKISMVCCLFWAQYAPLLVKVNTILYFSRLEQWHKNSVLLKHCIVSLHTKYY